MFVIVCSRLRFVDVLVWCLLVVARCCYRCGLLRVACCLLSAVCCTLYVNCCCVVAFAVDCWLLLLGGGCSLLMFVVGVADCNCLLLLSLLMFGRRCWCSRVQ